jgi:hypothetical protein
MMFGGLPLVQNLLLCMDVSLVPYIVLTLTRYFRSIVMPFSAQVFLD